MPARLQAVPPPAANYSSAGPVHNILKLQGTFCCPSEVRFGHPTIASFADPPPSCTWHAAGQQMCKAELATPKCIHR